MNKNMNIRTHVQAHITNACTCIYMCVSVYVLVCACGFVCANNTVWPWCSTETHEKLHPHTLPPAHAPWPKHIKIKTQKDVHKHNQTQSSCPTNTPCPQYEAAAALCRYISRAHDDMIFVHKQALKNGLMCLHRRRCQVLTRKRSRLALGHGAP